MFSERSISEDALSIGPLAEERAGSDPVRNHRGSNKPRLCGDCAEIGRRSGGRTDGRGRVITCVAVLHGLHVCTWKYRMGGMCVRGSTAWVGGGGGNENGPSTAQLSARETARASVLQLCPPFVNSPVIFLSPGRRRLLVCSPPAGYPAARAVCSTP